jgi:serine/threonine protein kinase
VALSAGTRLGPYEILESLGAGGMGEVHRARDTRLGREVALKVLPEAGSADAGRLRRFAREARAVAALDHPNILAIHDVGSHQGRPYLVTELLEGDSLQVRLVEGGLTVAGALELAIPIAQALAAAHAKGIVHRDLKPANLFLTKDGRVKVLDFGLAKLSEEAEPGSEEATASRPTEAGTILGTVGYMSPEQARGRVSDHRTDIFSFGVVLSEMLARRAPFLRGSALLRHLEGIRAISMKPTPVRSKISSRETCRNARSSMPSDRRSR